MSLLRWIIALPIIVGAVLFAVANPDPVTLTWSPFHKPTELPLYFVVLAFLGAGFLLGAFMAWLGMGKTRAERRRLKRENKQMEKDINEANEKLTESLAQQKKIEPAPSVIDMDDEDDE
ncbi:MAG: LapA family protein [Alphaproteobacteria bacterium]|nr:LapA family protein [Alphaproteobacteria bacterium]